MPHGPERISPTAHYTGHVWQLEGLSTPALATPAGPRLYASLEPLMSVSRRFGGPTLRGMLAARHRTIDRLLDAEIAAGRIGQVVEVAAGYSPRGWRFKKRYGSKLSYWEADLPHMAQRKRELLTGVPQAERPEVFAVNALEAAGPLSLAALGENLDRTRGLALITEGLVGYLDTASVSGMWRRMAALLGEFPAGMYVSDLRLRGRTRDSVAAKLFMRLLAAFVRGRVHLHFEDEADAVAGFGAAGFAESRLVHPRAVLPELPPDPGADHVQIVQATSYRLPTTDDQLTA